MREYEFELRLCAYLERVTDGIVARQLGGGVADPAGRILDVVVIEPGEAVDRRVAITDETIPVPAIECDVGPGRWTRWPGAVDLRPETAARVLETAVDVGFFEHERRSGADWVRQVTRYPAWFGPIVAIENKPDLDAPGDLNAQLRRDVSLGLVDEVILATGSHVTGAHLNRIPDAVGVWRVRFDDGDPDIEVIREPTPLEPEAWGLEVGDREPTRRRVRTVSPDEKARARVRLAERAYGTGWRSPIPGCVEARTGSASGTASLPDCAWKERIVDPAGCGPDCPGYEPADPPTVDREAERERRTPWVSNPAGISREQAGLASFVDPDPSP